MSIFIIGMHRSGTSLLTNILTELGLFTGDKADKDTNHETRLLITCNEILLKEFGASWDYPLPFRYKMQDPSNFQKAINLLKQLLHDCTFEMERFLGDEYANSKSLGSLNILWGAKDPRLTFTIPIWAELFTDCKIININRHGVDVAKSLYNRQNKVLESIKTEHNIKRFKSNMVFKTGLVEHTMRCMDTEGAFDLWVEYMEEAAKQVSAFGNRALSIAYEDLLQTPGTIVSVLIEYCNLSSNSIVTKEAIDIIKLHNYNKYKSDPKLLEFSANKKYELSRFGY